MGTVLKTNYEDFANIMTGFARDGNDICCITYADNTFNLLRELMSCRDVIPKGINIEWEEVNGYDKEYFVELTKEMFLFIEPAYHEDNEYHEAGYYNTWADMIFVDMDADERIYPSLFTEYGEIHKVEFRMISSPEIHMTGEEESCFCKECCECKDDDFEFEFDDEYPSLRSLLREIKTLLDDYFE